MHPLLKALRDPAYSSSRRALAPFALLAIGGGWLAGWGWWSLLLPVAVLAGLFLVGLVVWLATRGGDKPLATGWTPLDRPDATPVPAAPPSRADLELLLDRRPAPFRGWAETRLWLAAWGRAVPLRVICGQDEGPDGVWPETAAAVAAVHGWGRAERQAVRRLLLEDAHASLAEVGEPCPFTLETIEAEARVVALTFDQVSPARAGVGLLELMPSWEPEHGVAIVIRDGRPAEAINGLRADPSEAFLAG